jgi:hypothetical protein
MEHTIVFKHNARVAIVQLERTALVPLHHHRLPVVPFRFSSRTSAAVPEQFPAELVRADPPVISFVNTAQYLVFTYYIPELRCNFWSRFTGSSKQRRPDSIFPDDICIGEPFFHIIANERFQIFHAALAFWNVC